MIDQARVSLAWQGRRGIPAMARARKIIGAALIAAMLAGSAAPAAARPWGYHGSGWGYGHGWHRRHGGDGFGNFVLGAVVAGGVIAAVSAANDHNRQVAGARERSYDDGRYPQSGPDNGYRDDDRADAGPATEEDAAVDACADAAGAQAATRFDRNARVDDISYSGRDGQGWRVEGNVATGYQGQVHRHFVCGVRATTVDFVQFVDQSTER
jgi:hypothetical protein